jgi:glycosyltransferase involved in cell wall biosynthesis
LSFDVNMKRIKVVQFLRKYNIYNHSVERIYQDMRSRMTEVYNDIYVETKTNRFNSKGVLRRLWDAIIAALFQGDVNHVTGDVHYLTYFLRRDRTVLTILDCIILERSKGLKFWFLWFLWFWLPEKCCVAIHVISEYTREQLIHYLDCNPDKIRVIYCSLSLEFYPCSKSINSSCPTILHIGTTPNKNLERHIEALNSLDCKLVIIGPLSDAQMLILRNNKLSYENLVDISREEVVNQYKHCDLLLYASTYEGFGLPIIEAQAVGRPVITSNICSMAEIAGDAACLVDPFNVDSIRNGVKRVIIDANYRADLVEKGFKNIRRFDLNVITAQYVELYREVYDNSYKKSYST